MDYLSKIVAVIFYIAKPNYVKFSSADQYPLALELVTLPHE